MHYIYQDGRMIGENKRNCIWKCRLENGGHFVSASMCFNSARHGDAYTHQWTGSPLLQLRVNNRCHQCRLFVKIIMRNKYQWNLNQRMRTNFQRCSQLKWILENFGQCIHASLYKMRPVVGHYKRNFILFLYMPITILQKNRQYVLKYVRDNSLSLYIYIHMKSTVPYIFEWLHILAHWTIIHRIWGKFCKIYWPSYIYP